MNEINYNEVFGIETSSGENDPAPAQQDAGAVDSNAAAAGEIADDTAGANETETAEPSVEENAFEAQTKEERAKQAAARRQREMDAAIEKVRTEERANAQRSLDESIKALGLTNSFTGQPINTKAEYDEWKRKEAEQKKGEVAEAAGMDEREFDNFVNNLPQVQAANRAAEAAIKQHQRLVLDEQIKEIGKLDPSIKSVEDLMKDQETYKAIYEKVQRGNSIVEAYKLVNFDKLTAAAGSAAKQAALNAANSKDHLTATTARGAGSVTVPADVRAMYHQMMPEMTEAQIQEHYNRFHKN